jgi:hypothetical protein
MSKNSLFQVMVTLCVVLSACVDESQTRVEYRTVDRAVCVGTRSRTECRLRFTDRSTITIHELRLEGEQVKFRCGLEKYSQCWMDR